MPLRRLVISPLAKLAFCIALIGLHASPLRAAPVTGISNLRQPLSTTTAVGKASGFNFQQAVSFTTGPAASELYLATVYGERFGNLKDFKLTLCTGVNSAGPVGIMATLINDRSPTSSIVLAANTTYWLVASAPDTEVNSFFAWSSTPSFAADPGGLPGWSIGSTRWVSNNGVSWFPATGGANPQFTVDVNLLPPIAPAISGQPKSQSVFVGTSVTLSVTATGSPAPGYQWRKEGVAIPGATRNTLSLNPVTAGDAGRYSVVVSNSAGSVTSETATLEISAPVAAVSNLSQTFATTVTVGKGTTGDFQQAISFTTGPAITELSRITLWGTGISGVSGFTLTLHSGISPTGPTGFIAALTGNAAPTSLANYSYTPSSTVRLSPNSTYWLVVSVPATSSGVFSWRVTNSLDQDAGSLPGWSIGNTRWFSPNAGGSWQAVVTPIPQFSVDVSVPPAIPPSITTSPSSQVATAGSSLTLSVVAAGNPVPTFQWHKDGVAISGATNSSLTMASVSRSNSGSYSVVVSNSAGSVTSEAAQVEVIPASAFSNFSLRTTMAAEQVVIVGAVVTVATGEAKPILVRAAGPALNGFNLAGMADPRLELYTGGAQPTATNDDWPAALAGTFTSVGAFPFASASKDAALSQSLVGPFTIQTKGTGAGTVLIEAYDVAGGTSARLINFSVRNRVGTGADILIAGFALSGTGAKQVLIRAVGPGLAALGVPGTLADPSLQVLNSSGTVIGSNNNWDAALAPVFTQVGAFALPASSRDSALLISLNAGATYTVQVSGADGGTGEALIEVYEVF